MGGWRRWAGPAWPPWRGRSSPSAPTHASPARPRSSPWLGTGAALVAGTRASRFGPARLLGRGAHAAIGTVSYTWYLWHWPALILAPYVVGHRLGLAQKVGVGLCSLVLAALTTALVEQPLRQSTWLSARNARSLAGGRRAQSRRGAGWRWWSIAAVPPPVGTGGHVARLSPRTTLGATTPRTGSRASSLGHGLAAGRRRRRPMNSLDAQVNRSGVRVAGQPERAGNLTPSLSDAAADAPAPEDGCLNGFTDTSVHPCIYGDTGSSK